MADSPKAAITVRLDPRKRDELDRIAQMTARDRSFLVNEAIDSYLSLHRWQIAHIENGVRQADSGDFASDEDVSEAFKRWQ